MPLKRMVVILGDHLFISSTDLEERNNKTVPGHPRLL